VFCLWQLGDVGPGVLQGDELPAVRQHNRIVEATLPGQVQTPAADTEIYGRTSGWAITLGVPPGAHQSLAACHVVLFLFYSHMDAEKEREIIRLWNRLRLLEKEGRQTAVVRRLIEEALAERERHAA
jgi:hypothetical protein